MSCQGAALPALVGSVKASLFGVLFRDPVKGSSVAAL